MRSLHHAVPILAVAVLGACAESTDPSADGSRLVFDFTNGPASPGNSGIFRSQGGFFSVVVDPRAGLISFVGLQNTIADFCNDAGEFDLMDFQVKPHSAGEVSSLILDGDAAVQIVALAPPTCANLSGAPVLYSGTAAYRRTDNNFTETGTEGGRANSFGHTAQGVLDDLVHGGHVNFSEAVRFVIDPITENVSVLVSKITLTPIR
jgi:hypothetical protein